MQFLVLSRHRTDQFSDAANRTWHGLPTIADTVRAPLILWPDDSATF